MEPAVPRSHLAWVVEERRHEVHECLPRLDAAAGLGEQEPVLDQQGLDLGRVARVPCCLVCLRHAHQGLGAGGDLGRHRLHGIR